MCWHDFEEWIEYRSQALWVRWTNGLLAFTFATFREEDSTDNENKPTVTKLVTRQILFIF